MNNFILFLSNNTVTILVVAIITVAMIVTFCLFKNNPMDKVGSNKQYILYNEYTTFRDKSKKAIVNTTVSFSAESCKNKYEIDNLYVRTVTVGNRILKEEGFKISTVQKV